MLLFIILKQICRNFALETSTKYTLVRKQNKDIRAPRLLKHKLF